MDYNGLGRGQVLDGLGTPAKLGVFSPASLTGIVWWFKADANVYSDTGTTPATDGDPVVQWNDQSGNGHTLQNTSGSQRQVFKTNQQNSLPAVSGTSGQNWNKTAGGTGVTAGTTKWTVWAVGKRGGAGKIFPVCGPVDDGAAVLFVIFSDNNIYTVDVNNNTYGPLAYSGSNVWTLYRCRLDGSNTVKFKGGGQSEGNVSTVATSNLWRIQGPFNRDHQTQDPDATSFLGECIVTSVDTAADYPSESSAVDSYLQNRWNVTY